MYTEISHFLLLHAISQEILRIFFLSILWLPRGAETQRGSPLLRRGTKTANSAARINGGLFARVPKPKSLFASSLQAFQWKPKGRASSFRPWDMEFCTASPLPEALLPAKGALRQPKGIWGYAWDKRGGPGSLRGTAKRENHKAWFRGLGRREPVSETLFSIELTHLILTSCFFGTISNYVCSDFSVYNILTNSIADVPLFYKISATWSNHEGSLLLWCWLLSLNAFLFCISICNTQFKCFSFLVASFLFVANSVSRIPVLHAVAGAKQRESARGKQLSCEANGLSTITDRAARSRGHYHTPGNGREARLMLTRHFQTERLLGDGWITKPPRKGRSRVCGDNPKSLTAPLSVAAKRLLPIRSGLNASALGHGLPRKGGPMAPATAKAVNSASGFVKETSWSNKQMNGFNRFAIRTGLAASRPFEHRWLWMTFFRCTNSLHFSREQQQYLITKTAFSASLILIFFTFFILRTSNPFLRTSIPSINSLAELNPILQDPVLAIHPPCIYAGYVASAIAFSLCMSTFLLEPRTRTGYPVPSPTEIGPRSDSRRRC